jgi:hypothetical protein
VVSRGAVVNARFVRRACARNVKFEHGFSYRPDRRLGFSHNSLPWPCEGMKNNRFGKPNQPIRLLFLSQQQEFLGNKKKHIKNPPSKRLTIQTCRISIPRF